MIELGDKVKCIYTGFTGVAVAKTEFINGCVQYEVVPSISKGKNEFPESIGIDEQSLKVVSKKKSPPKRSETGGRSRPAPRQRGF